MENKLSQERGSPFQPSQLKRAFIWENLSTLSELSADKSARACSDCFALTELTWLGKSKCLYGEKLARPGG